jgi:hypothetical protein
MSAPRTAPGARTILKLRFPPPARPGPPEFSELLERIDRLETRQSRRNRPQEERQ